MGSFATLQNLRHHCGSMSGCFFPRLTRLAVFAALISVTVEGTSCHGGAIPSQLQALDFNNPGLTVDLGIGLWGNPIPIESKDSKHPDLILVVGSKASSGTYYYENTGTIDPGTGLDLFKKPVRLGPGEDGVSPSYTADGLRVLGHGVEFPDFLHGGCTKPVPLPAASRGYPLLKGMVRERRWSYVDYDGDGKLDLVEGIDSWGNYGWDNAYDTKGNWTRGSLHGLVYLLKNTGTNANPVYAPAVPVEAGGKPVDVFGRPSPVFADFTGSGKLDLICGEFLDGLTYFQNIGTREKPRYAAGRRLTFAGKPLAMPLEMMTVVAYDWNHDGRMDLIVSQEDGRVAWLENTGRVVEGMPEFKPPRFFTQEADKLRFGVLATPIAFDWDGDGLTDLLVGDSAGEIAFIKNLGGDPPRWAAPILLEAGGKPIRIMAGANGSIQGPAEAKWGYTNIGVGDWDGDGLPDLLVNSIWGKIVWYKNIGTRTHPKLAPAQPVKVVWNSDTPKPAWNWWNPEPDDLVTQWRSTPYVIDLDGDGIDDLVTLDTEGYLAWYRQVVRDGKRVLLPGQRIFQMKGNSIFGENNRPEGGNGGPLRLNNGVAGHSGRRTFCFVDWDGDGKLDLMVNSGNANFFRNISTTSGQWLFEDEGPVDGWNLTGHNTTPTAVYWKKDGRPRLLIGAEDGQFYYLKNPLSGK